MLFNVLPTLLEILLVAVILWVLFDWRFAAVTFVTIVAYIGSPSPIDRAAHPLTGGR